MLPGAHGLPHFPSEKRVLLVKELQGLTVAQRDHMLRAMPLSLAEKRCLRSVPPARAAPRPTPSRAGWRARRALSLQWVVPGRELGPPWPGPDAASACREETRTPRGWQGRRGLPSCCNRFQYACVLVGASWAGLCFWALLLGPHLGWGWGGHPSFLCRPACGVP